jgi:hypothetical protein
MERISAYSGSERMLVNMGSVSMAGLLGGVLVASR